MTEDKGYPFTHKETAYAEQLHSEVMKDLHPKLREFDKGRIHAAIAMLTAVKHRSYKSADEVISHYLAWLAHYSHKDRA